MKKILLAIMGIVVLSSCRERGDIEYAPTNFIEINGKTYKLVRVVPEDGEYGIWILYPKDTADKMPQVLNYTVPQGKATRMETVIKVD